MSRRLAFIHHPISNQNYALAQLSLGTKYTGIQTKWYN